MTLALSPNIEKKKINTSSQQTHDSLEEAAGHLHSKEAVLENPGTLVNLVGQTSII